MDFPFLRYSIIIVNRIFVHYFVVVVYDSLTGAMIDPLIAGLAYHATCQIKILKYNLENLGKLKSSEIYGVQFEDIFQHLRRCINRHRNILKYIMRLKVLY